MREIASEYRKGHWGEIMGLRSENGLSITKFCEREGMHVNRYHYWQRRLRAAAVAEIEIQEAESAVASTGLDASEGSRRKHEYRSAGLTIEIGKCRVPVNAATNEDLLTKVCKVLVSIC